MEVNLVDQVIYTQNASLEIDGLYVGLDNTCSVNKGMFHVYIDCDLKSFQDVVDACEKISHLVGDIYILQTSPWMWSVVSFSSHSWLEYLEIMGSFRERELAYEWMTYNKGFACLRVGRKRNLAPRIMYKIRGRKIECEHCRSIFESVLSYYNKPIIVNKGK